MVTPSDLGALRQLCHEVLAAELSYAEFSARVATIDCHDEFIRGVVNDLEEGVLHTPSHLLSRRVDRPAWMRSPEYFDVYLDCYLLEYEPAQATGDLLRCKRVVDAAFTRRPSETDIRLAVDRCLGGEDSLTSRSEAGS
jgi:hypothetical protein